MAVLYCSEWVGRHQQQRPKWQGISLWMRMPCKDCVWVSVCVLCCCSQYRVDSTSGIIAGPRSLSLPMGNALCTISCPLGRKRPATVLSRCQSFMMHLLTHSANVLSSGDERAGSIMPFVFHSLTWPNYENGKTASILSLPPEAVFSMQTTSLHVKKNNNICVGFIYSGSFI